jgi:hypothetical protein
MFTRPPVATVRGDLFTKVYAGYVDPVKDSLPKLATPPPMRFRPGLDVLRW